MPKNRHSWKPRVFHFDFFLPRGLDSSFDISDNELADQLDGTKTSTLFLGNYNTDQIKDALKRFGVSAKLAKRGYENIEVAYTHHGPFAYRLTFESCGKDCFLGEIIIKEGSFTPKTEFIDGHDLKDMDLLLIEWLLMQNPKAPFAPSKPRLPGQNHPGLGIGHEVINLLESLAMQMSKEGLLNFPEYINNALIYSEAYSFFDPRKQAEMLAIWRDLSELGMDLAQVSWAVYFECVRSKDCGDVCKWFAEEQILPRSERTRAYFDDPEYAEAVRTYLEDMHFEIDQELYQKKMKTIDQITW